MNLDTMVLTCYLDLLPVARRITQHLRLLNIQHILAQLTSRLCSTDPTTSRGSTYMKGAVYFK